MSNFITSLWFFAFKKRKSINLTLIWLVLKIQYEECNYDILYKGEEKISIIYFFFPTAASKLLRSLRKFWSNYSQTMVCRSPVACASISDPLTPALIFPQLFNYCLMVNSLKMSFKVICWSKKVRSHCFTAAVSNFLAAGHLELEKDARTCPQAIFLPTAARGECLTPKPNIHRPDPMVQQARSSPRMPTSRSGARRAISKSGVRS